MHFSTLLRRRLRHDEAGFSFIEVLVVTIIIGILAAIALALLIGERAKAQDANAKSDVSAIALDLEACYVEEGDFTECNSSTDLQDVGVRIDPLITTGTSCSDPGFGLGGEGGTVGIVSVDVNCFVLVGTSESEDGGARHEFVIRREDNGARSRRCGPQGPSPLADIRGVGGCPSDGTW